MNRTGKRLADMSLAKLRIASTKEETDGAKEDEKELMSAYMSFVVGLNAA